MRFTEAGSAALNKPPGLNDRFRDRSALLIRV